MLMALYDSYQHIINSFLFLLSQVYTIKFFTFKDLIGVIIKLNEMNDLSFLSYAYFRISDCNY